MALERNATLEQRQREEALEMWDELRLKWWVLRPSDQYLLDKDHSFFITSKFVNVYVWRRNLKAALVRGESLQENKGGDIRKYLRRVGVDDRASLHLIPTQVSHRKVKRRRVLPYVGSGVDANTSSFTKLKQCVLNFNIASRMVTTQDTHGGSPVK